MHPLTEEEETVLGEGGGRGTPPSLPPTPLIISPEGMKRRFILNSLIQSENNYLGTHSNIANKLFGHESGKCGEGKLEYQVATLIMPLSVLVLILLSVLVCVLFPITNKNWDEGEKR